MTPSRVLVVDDDAAIRELLVLRLRRHGLEVVEAANGQAALETLSARPPDLIVLDLKMPRLNGYEVMERLQVHPQWRCIPVIIITANGSWPPNDPRAQKAAAYVIKPFSLKALAETVLRLLPTTS